jgi:hypothetical protein
MAGRVAARSQIALKLVGEAPPRFDGSRSIWDCRLHLRNDGRIVRACVGPIVKSRARNSH